MRRYHVASGMVRTAAAPATIRAVVASGYVVAAVSRAGCFGGMAHLRQKVGGPIDGPSREQIAALVTALQQQDLDLSAGTAFVVGGADPIAILPVHLRETSARSTAAAITALLNSHRLPVDRTIVGGREARDVVLSLPGGELEVTAATTLLARPPVDGGVRGPSPAGEDSRPAQVNVDMGCARVDRAPTQLVCLLGSCVGVALFDPTTHIGGLAHVMLPRHPGDGGAPAKYADTAVVELLRIMTEAGARRAEIRAKLAGGACSFCAEDGSLAARISEDNVTAARAALACAGVGIEGEEVGGRHGRRIVIDLCTFQIRVTSLGPG